jgi:hypothetical protein
MSIRQLFSEEGRKQDRELWFQIDLLERHFGETFHKIQNAGSDDEAENMLADFQNEINSTQRLTLALRGSLSNCVRGLRQSACALRMPAGLAPSQEQAWLPKF